MFREKLYTCSSDKFRRTQQKILALICNKSMSKHELAKELELNHSTINNHIYFLKKNGLIYIECWQDNPCGKATAKYKFGVNEDAPFVARRKYKSTYKRKEVFINLKMPRCDIAASWLNNPC